MTHETRTPPPDADRPDTKREHLPSVPRRPAPHNTKDRLRRWGETIGDLLARAEKRIQENFRVPPGGG